MKHKHHIIPRHAGGTDEPENLIELTVEEHAEAHRKLYEQYGRIQDHIAYMALAGKTSFSEARRAAAANSVWDEKRRKRASEVNKMAREKGKLSNIGDVMRGKQFDPEHKTKLSEIAKRRDKIVCSLCGVSAIKQTIYRWHGEGKCNIEPDLESPKTCRVCGEVKTLKHFGMSGKKQNGHKMFKTSCYVCDNKARREREKATLAT